MSKSVQSQFEDLFAELQRDFPANASKLTLFPSGSAMLDVEIGAETYVAEFMKSLGDGVGISKLSTATYGWEGCESVFASFDEAKVHLLSLLKES